MNFNYTSTLESLYHVKKSRVCHIHGSVFDENDPIYFGHGDDTDFEEIPAYMGIDEAYNKLKRSLRKNTKNAIKNNEDFFAKLKKVSCIYTYGFSFSDVDMCYIDEICKYIKPYKVRWYFNSYDWINNRENVNKIKGYGFKVRRCKRW